LRIDHRWAALDEGSVQRFARELVALMPDVILTQSTPNTVALLQQTRTIPIVLTQGTDPVGAGFVASLSPPGGNVTGFINLEASLGSKWLKLLKQIAPRVNRVAFLFKPATAPMPGRRRQKWRIIRLRPPPVQTRRGTLRAHRLPA
jgi:putative ABC transport system substrate-binding protein